MPARITKQAAQPLSDNAPSLIHASDFRHFFEPSTNAWTANSSLTDGCTGSSSPDRFNQLSLIFLGQRSPSFYPMDGCLRWFIRGTARIVFVSVHCGGSLVQQGMERRTMAHNSLDRVLRRGISGRSRAAPTLSII